jgi:hypothetical protein
LGDTAQNPQQIDRPGKRPVILILEQELNFVQDYARSPVICPLKPVAKHAPEVGHRTRVSGNSAAPGCV